MPHMLLRSEISRLLFIGSMTSMIHFGAPLPTVEMTVEVEYRVRHCRGISGLRLS